FSHHEDDVVDVSGLGDAPSAQGPRGEPPRLRRGPRPGPQFPGRLRAAARAALARSGGRGGRRGRSLSCSCAAAVGGVVRVVGGWCGRRVVPCGSRPRGVHVPPPQLCRSVRGGWAPRWWPGGCGRAAGPRGGGRVLRFAASAPILGRIARGGGARAQAVLTRG